MLIIIGQIIFLTFIFSTQFFFTSGCGNNRKRKIDRDGSDKNNRRIKFDSKLADNKVAESPVVTKEDGVEADNNGKKAVVPEPNDNKPIPNEVPKEGKESKNNKARNIKSLFLIKKTDADNDCGEVTEPSKKEKAAKKECKKSKDISKELVTQASEKAKDADNDGTYQFIGPNCTNDRYQKDVKKEIEDLRKKLASVEKNDNLKKVASVEKNDNQKKTASVEKNDNQKKTASVEKNDSPKKEIANVVKDDNPKKEKTKDGNLSKEKTNVDQTEDDKSSKLYEGLSVKNVNDRPPPPPPPPQKAPPPPAGEKKQNPSKEKLNAKSAAPTKKG